MRHTRQTEHSANVGPILHHRDDAAMVELEIGCQHHQREQLVLRKILAAEPTGVGRQGGLRNLQGLPGQRHRRPRHRSCGFHSTKM